MESIPCSNTEIISTNKKRILLSSNNDKEVPKLLDDTHKKEPFELFMKKIGLRNDSDKSLIKIENNTLYISNLSIAQCIKEREKLITKEISSFTDNELDTLDDDDIYCTYETLRGAEYIRVRDVKTLNDTVFINDVIINFYLHIINKTFSKYQTSFYIFNTFFFPILCEGNTNEINIPYVLLSNSIVKMKSKIDIFTKQYVIVPIFNAFHWSLVIILHPGKMKNISSSNYPVIIYLDSYITEMKPCVRIIQKYLYHLLDDRKEPPIEEYLEKVRKIKTVMLNVPMQPNCYDCGVFMLHFIEKFLINPNSIEQNVSAMNLNMKEWFEPNEACAKRENIRKILFILRKEGKEK